MIAVCDFKIYYQLVDRFITHETIETINKKNLFLFFYADARMYCRNGFHLL